MKKIKQLYRYTDEIITEAYNKVAVEVYMMSKKCGYKSFAICGSEPQTGATSVAINLSIALSMAGWKTLLIDADLYKKNKRLNEEAGVGLSEYLAGYVEKNEIFYQTEYDKLCYIPCGNHLDNPISLLCSNKLIEVLEYVNNNYDYIIWDLPSVYEAADTKIVCSQTEATIIVGAQYASKDLLNDTKNIIEEAGGNIVGIIGNKVEQSEYKQYRKIKRRKK